MFGRRVKRKTSQKIRESLWPSMGLNRVTQYWRHRVGRLAETPAAIALGFANGVAISFTPFLGFHLLLSVIVTWATRGSMIATLVGGVVGNPWTFPFIWVATYKLGREMLGEKADVARVPAQFVVTDILDKPMDLLLPMTLGCLPFAVVSWLVAFYVVRHIVTQYKAQRTTRIADNAARARKKKEAP